MTLPDNLPALLRAAGLKVVEIDGWKTRGRPASTGGFAPVGVLHHHTGGPSNGGKAYASGVLVKGRSDLPGPLCHLSTDRDGTVYIVAAGRANHAGVAKSVGTVAGGDGNRLYVGVENQNLGTEGWTAKQYAAMVTLTAVLLTKVLHTSEQTVHAHYETSTTGKWDPGNPKAKGGVKFGSTYVLNMKTFRKDVAAMVSDMSKPAAKSPTRVTKARDLLNAAVAAATKKGKTARVNKIKAALKSLPSR